MDKTLQKKLVGAAVLIALAVIFLPMFLDGKKDVESSSMQIEIPPKPVYDIPNRLEKKVPPPVAEAVPPQRTLEVKPIQEQIPEPPAIEPPPPPVQEAPAEEVAKVTPPVEAATPKSKPEPKPAVKSRPAAPSGAGFVVQVGSFSQRQNAAVLTDKLVAAGFPAFVEDIDFRGRSIFRVKVGPRPSREAVDELRQRLIDTEKLEGIVVAHP